LTGTVTSDIPIFFNWHNYQISVLFRAIGKSFGVGEEQVTFTCVGESLGAMAEIASYSHQSHNCGYYNFLFHCSWLLNSDEISLGLDSPQR